MKSNPPKCRTAEGVASPGRCEFFPRLATAILWTQGFYHTVNGLREEHSVLRDAAVSYAELGYAVFQLRPGGKQPATANGLYAATSDPATVEQLWRERPNCNIGIRMDGLLGVDIDGADNPWPEKHEWRDDLRKAPTVYTPRGGRHHYFRQRAGSEHGATAGLLADHVDTRANKSYLVAPPSVGPDGIAYRFELDRGLDVPPSDLPEVPLWAEALLQAKRRAATTASSPIAQRAIAEGKRNATLTSFAGMLRRQGLERDEILAAVSARNHLACFPPLDDREIGAIADSVARYEPKPREEFRLEGIPVGAFLRMNFHQDPLIWCDDGRTIVESQQNCVVGGGMKGMKTSVATDAGLALATGTMFLGEFRTKKSRVAFLTAESGKPTIQDHLRRICEARRIDIAEDFADLVIEDKLPRVSEPGHLPELERFCGEGRFDVVILDPLYWALAGDAADRGAGNIYTMGGQLQKLGQAIPKGATCLLVHHFGKAAARNGVNSGEPPTLEDLAMAGVGEWMRQWMLLGRRTPYDGESGTHHLWMNVGGSAGHSSLWGLDIREGRQNDIGGRRWAVTVRSASDVFEEREDQAEAAGPDRRERAVETHRDKVVEFIRKQGAVTKTDVRKCRGVRKQIAEDVFDDLLMSGELVPGATITRGNGRSYPAYKLSSGPSGSDPVRDLVTTHTAPLYVVGGPGERVIVSGDTEIGT